MIVRNRPVNARIYRASADKKVIGIELIIPGSKSIHPVYVIRSHDDKKDYKDIKFNVFEMIKDLILHDDNEILIKYALLYDRPFQKYRL